MYVVVECHYIDGVKLRGLIIHQYIVRNHKIVISTVKNSCSGLNYYEYKVGGYVKKSMEE